MKVLVVIISLILASIRIWIGLNLESHATLDFVSIYKDIAHIFIGGLVVSWWYNRFRWKDCDPFHYYYTNIVAYTASTVEYLQSQPYEFYIFWFLSVVEVITAIISV